MRNGPVAIESAWVTDWIPLDTTRDGNVPGPVWKPLSTDEATGACTYLMHLPPGWHDNVLDYHPGAEEGFTLGGACELGVPGEEGHTVLSTGDYMYRPPGILHGPAASRTVDGATILQRMSSELRILRYTGDEFPHVHLQPITDEHETWPIAWEERIDLAAREWQEARGGWSGARYKQIFSNRETGGGCVLLDLPAGWSGSGSPAKGCLEEFVIEGDLTAGGTTFGRWGYAVRPAGSPAGTYATENGAQLICFWDDSDEFAA